MNTSKKNLNVSEENIAKLAILIDADNTSAKDIENILNEATKYGEATIKRIYGNFVGQNCSWKQVINNLAIKPMQQFAYTTGKNATDGFMIIDAMDILFTNRIDGFVIVSSDSDFTALAIRMKEHGAIVYGFGKNHTSEAFRNACTHFIYVENLTGYEESMLRDPAQGNINGHPQPERIQAPKSATHLPLIQIKQVFDNHDSEWISMSSFGSQWKQLQVDFDPRTYGFKKLGDLVRAHTNIFEIQERSTLTSEHKNLFVRLKFK